jgi:hypothetical protein
MVDTSPFAIKKHFMYMWVHQKGQSNQKYDKTANFTLHFNKAALIEANLCKLDK